MEQSAGSSAPQPYILSRLQNLILKGERLLTSRPWPGQIDAHDLWFTEARNFLLANAPDLAEEIMIIAKPYLEGIWAESKGESYRAYYNCIQSQVEVLKKVYTRFSDKYQQVGEKTVNITISNSSVGVLNTGEIENIHSLNVSISTLLASGHRDIATALKSLAEAVATSQEIAASQRTELLDQLEHLSKQAALPPEQRAKTGVIKGIMTGIATTLSATGGLAEVWSTWGNQIRAFFGL